ncbi:T9SS type A sorting domain-containing protein [Candidatus Poribacteria bacterium]
MEITAPVDPVPVGTEITASAVITNVAEGQSVNWHWGDGSDPDPVNETGGCVSAAGNHTYTEAGVYTVSLKVTDAESVLLDESVFQYVVVYDPSAGFVTGGGWIDSPEGAYAPDPTLTGEATFGFVAKYKKEAEAPTGNTEFVFYVADLEFHSESYDWLVLAGHKAMFKGTGAINDGGDYGFLLSATDAALTPSTDEDLFRIKIWDRTVENEPVVYDNQMGDADDADITTAIGGGSIVIHEEQGPAAAPAAPKLVPERPRLLACFPNPSNPEVWIPYQLNTDSQVTIRIYGVTGRLIRTLDLGHRPAGFYASRSKAAHWDGSNEVGERVSSGIYFYSIQAGDFTATRKLIITR